MKKLLLSAICTIVSMHIFAYDFQVDEIYYRFSYDFPGSVEVCGNFNYLTPEEIEQRMTPPDDPFEPVVETPYYLQASADSYSGDVVVPETVTYNGVSYQVKSVAYSTFLHNDVHSVVLPSSIEKIDIYAFYYANIEKLVIGGDIKEIGREAFSGCSALKELDIRNMQSNMDLNDFILLEKIHYPDGAEYITRDYVWNINTIFLNAKNPRADSHIATLQKDKFQSKVVIVVPDGAKAAYKNHTFWGGFTTIKEMSEYSQLEQLPVKNFYTIHGSLITNTSKEYIHIVSVDGRYIKTISPGEVFAFETKGVYILQLTNGFTNKLMIK